MTLVEHLKSDSDVVKLIVFSVGAIGLCVYLVYLITTKLGFWRKKAQGKPRQLQRPFIASHKISPTPKDGSPSFRLSPFKHLSPNIWSVSSSPSKTFASTSNNPTKPNKQLTYSPTPNVKQQQQSGKRFLSQIISSINRTDSKQSGRHSPLRSSTLKRQSPRDYNNPFVLDTSTTDDSTLPSLMLSSEESTENITDKVLDRERTITRIETMDKAINTEVIEDTNNDNSKKTTDTQTKMEIRKPRLPPRSRRDNNLSHLWSHKCPLPCVYEIRPSASPTWSTSSHSDMHHDNEHDDSISEADKQQDGSHRLSSDSNSRSFPGNKATFSPRKCAADAFVQTDYSWEVKVSMNQEQNDCKMSPLCSSDSTIKDTDHTLQCCCGKTNHKSRKHTKLNKKLKKSSLVRSLDRKLPDELEMFDNEASIMDKTSFIPPKSWYSLGSLCDEDENCETCGQNWKHDAHRNHHMRMYDSDTKLNLSGDAVSYNDTGYTSTEEDNSSRNSGDLKGDGSSCDQNSSPENGSYDGDYESDDEIFQVRLVGSEDMVYKPLPSISEPFGIEAYATKEWTGNTPNAKAIREGYAEIPRHVNCHQLRQIRGDNYCAIRATLFQALLNGIPVLNKLPKGGIPQVLRTILSSINNDLQEWSFAGRITVEKPDVISTLEEILAFFIEEVQRCQDINSKETKTELLLSLFNEETGNSEFKLLEAVKLIMLYHAVLLHDDINKGKEVPVLAFLLFARDTSTDPRGLLRNHLNSVGDSGGLEQVEMCLLGYSMGVVIQVFRPSQVSKPDFIANYPYLDDMPQFSPMVSLVAEDDRHYNIVV